MMGVYIKSMEMPKGIEMIVVFSDGTAHKCLPGMREYVEKEIAVSVPQHGRLGDLDALLGKINKICDRRDAGIISDLICLQQLLSAVRLAPTIIPAEEGQ